MREAYLTIDDSPSPHTEDLTDFLVERGVPAILFVRGDMTEMYGRDALVRAVDKGLTLGNHAWSHARASEKPFDFYTNDIRRTETVIDEVYKQAGVARGRKYFRFPHIDRGTGGWIMDYDALGGKDRADVIAVFSDGLNIDLTPPTPEMIEKKAWLQEFLKAEGFSRFPADGITFPWYRGELADAVDVPYTYSTADWMLLDRHRRKWPYKTLDDLKRKIDSDPWLQDEGSRHLILAHDKDQIEAVTRDLIDHCLEREIEFLPIP